MTKTITQQFIVDTMKKIQGLLKDLHDSPYSDKASVYAHLKIYNACQKVIDAENPRQYLLKKQKEESDNLSGWTWMNLSVQVVADYRQSIGELD
jgi:hypothetical protein